MKIHSIFVYSRDGRVREITFNVNGLNIITGHSSTGKSSLSEIVEFCMGRSTFNIPEGVIRDKVSWFGVIFQFEFDQIMIIKPTPKPGYSSSSTAMVRQGADLSPPSFDDLQVNSDDDTVVTTLSNMIRIPENRTEVSLEHSRSSFQVNIKHCFYYLFQKQSIVANKDQLLYRQNEDQQPQTIRDTLPILLGVSSDDRYELQARLRHARRELTIKSKLLADARDFTVTSHEKALSLLSEAKVVGIAPSNTSPENTDEVILNLKEAADWKPETPPEDDSGRIAEIENSIVDLRKSRREEERKLDNAKQFSKRVTAYASEADEQISRLSSIKALPKNRESGEWQWPFSESELGMTTPIGETLLRELESLEEDMQIVVGERPNLQAYVAEQEESIRTLVQRIGEREEELAAAIAANEILEEIGTRNNAAAKIVGRISLFLEAEPLDASLRKLESEQRLLVHRVEELEKQLDADDTKDRLRSIMNVVSSHMTDYVKELDAEFSEFPFYFDLAKLTVVIDRPERPVLMGRTGGGENHMAYHIASLLALHRVSAANKRPIPRFLFIDQPTQVYFPSEEVYKATNGSIAKTEEGSDLQAVRRLFRLLVKYSQDDAPNFQIIVTEHANLQDEWFQEALVENPWTKPPALIPEDWPY